MIVSLMNSGLIKLKKHIVLKIAMICQNDTSTKLQIKQQKVHFSFRRCIAAKFETI